MSSLAPAPGSKRRTLLYDSSTNMGRHRLTVGIDYGTTYSGISYVSTDKHSVDDIEVVNVWPSRHGECKAPTRIAYASENPDRLDEDVWGFQVGPGLISCSWTKLLLDSSQGQPTPNDDPALLEAIDQGIFRLPANKTAENVCEDYLRHLHTYFMTRLERTIDKAILAVTPMDFWLTVPAVWSDQAQNSTRDAAQRAGFGTRRGDTISVITEPEAAALAALKRSMRPGELNPPKAGENLLICDCGGGTVDITTYHLKSLQPRVDFEELCVGDGGKCGATFLDRNLLRLMEQRFGQSFRDVPIQSRGPGSFFMSAWESTKRDFGEYHSGRPARIGPIRIPGTHRNDWYDIEEAMVLLTREDIRHIFDPVVEKVIQLVSDQLFTVMQKGRTIDRVILIGGFGESAYLLSCLRAFCLRSGKIQVYGAENSQSAVVTGAALRGLEGTAPTSKCCRRFYGVALRMPFREGVDPESKATMANWDGAKMCRGRMMWLISKGATITEGTTKTTGCSFDPHKGETTGTEVVLYSCSLDAPPEYDDHPRVQKIGTIKVNWTPQDINRMKSRKEHGWYGRKTLFLQFDVSVNFGAQGGLLEVKSLVNKAVSGTTTINFD
ncbi:hsp70-like protein [Acrodontium crateriforme]|uniref:Hsp70-like protein n=1 Tax=Acrodontium crateriforme TaxID=150365 RepID=A0AAQ3M5J9_9PEZI|nr:hsp70-like protein [Acrodontium crateriforme]